MRDRGDRTLDLMTNFLSAEFIRRRIIVWEGEPPGEPKFKCGVLGAIGNFKCQKILGSAGALPYRKTIRQSLIAISGDQG